MTVPLNYSKYTEIVMSKCVSKIIRSETVSLEKYKSCVGAWGIHVLEELLKTQ